MWNTKNPYQSGSDIDDVLYVGKGNEVIDGRGGNDVLVIHNNYTDSGLRFDSTKGSWMLNFSSQVPLQLTDIESIKFNDVNIRLDDIRLTQSTQHVHTSGADHMVGNDFGYVLSSGNGDDWLSGNGGDDTLYGGKGIDIAIYRGMRDDYLVERNATTGMYTVQDLNANRDGTDTLGTIERLLFADGEFDIDDLATLKPGSEPPPLPPSPPSLNNNFFIRSSIDTLIPMVIFDWQESFTTNSSVAIYSAGSPAMVTYDWQDDFVTVDIVGSFTMDWGLYPWDGFSP